MLDLHKVPDTLLDPVGRVVDAALDAAAELTPDHVMVVGAWCRDILHSALGHTFPTTATRDLDLALALSSWDAYQALAASFVPVGNTGIRFRIADADVDLLPFGGIEDPQGVVEPPTRRLALSVWAFDEIFAASLPLALTDPLSNPDPDGRRVRSRQTRCLARSVGMARREGRHRSRPGPVLVRRVLRGTRSALRHPGRQ